MTKYHSSKLIVRDFIINFTADGELVNKNIIPPIKSKNYSMIFLVNGFRFVFGLMYHKITGRLSRKNLTIAFYDKNCIQRAIIDYTNDVEGGAFAIFCDEIRMRKVFKNPKDVSDMLLNFCNDLHCEIIKHKKGAKQ